jgi:hypothetical protein
MLETCSVPVPVLFNCLKHHLGFIKEFIHASIASNDIETISYQLRLIGDSQMDLYLGELTPALTAHQIIEQLRQKEVFERETYVNFLHRNSSGYQTITISDASVWVLRLGEVEGRYIHIHPGRYSPHTLRVKASTLKTAIALATWMKLHNYSEATVEIVNQVRKDILGASPVKSLSATEGLSKILRLLHYNSD